MPVGEEDGLCVSPGREGAEVEGYLEGLLEGAPVGLLVVGLEVGLDDG